MEIRKVEFSQKQGRRQMGKWPAVLNEYLESGFDSAEVFPDSSDAGFTRHGDACVHRHKERHRAEWHKRDLRFQTREQNFHHARKEGLSWDSSGFS